MIGAEKTTKELIRDISILKNLRIKGVKKKAPGCSKKIQGAYYSQHSQASSQRLEEQTKGSYSSSLGFWIH